MVIGQDIDINHDNVKDEFIVEHKNKKFLFSKPSYEQLIENKYDPPTDITKINEDDLFNYWYLLKELGVDTDPKNNTGRIGFNNQVLSLGKKDSLENTVRANIRKVLNPTPATPA